MWQPKITSPHTFRGVRLPSSKHCFGTHQFRNNNNRERLWRHSTNTSMRGYSNQFFNRTASWYHKMSWKMILEHQSNYFAGITTSQKFSSRSPPSIFTRSTLSLSLADSISLTFTLSAAYSLLASCFRLVWSRISMCCEWMVYRAQSAVAQHQEMPHTHQFIWCDMEWGASESGPHKANPSQFTIFIYICV